MIASTDSAVMECVRLRGCRRGELRKLCGEASADAAGLRSAMANLQAALLCAERRRDLLQGMCGDQARRKPTVTPCGGG